MSELDYETPPAPVYVPRVRNWWTPFRYAMFGALLRMPRHVWVPLWFLPILWVLTFLWAAFLWCVALVLLVPYAITAAIDLRTYNKRVARANVGPWADYFERGNT
jgi:hypothetical protein